MANYCYFEGKLVGKKEEVEEVFGYFKEHYDYSFVDYQKIWEESEEFMKDLDLSKVLIKSSMNLAGIIEEMLRFNLIEGKSREEVLKEYARIAEERLRDGWKKIKAFDFITDNVSEEDRDGDKINWDKVYTTLNQELQIQLEKFSERFDFERFLELIEKGRLDSKDLPKKPHFWRIFEIDSSEEGYDELGDYVLYFWGTCAWSLESALARDGYYSGWKEYYDQEWFKGTCIENVHEKFPDLKMEIISEGEMNDFSEHLVMKKGSLISETEGLEVCMYDSVEEAKEDGVKITEEELEFPVYKELPSWYYLSENDGSVYKVWEL